MRLSLWDETLWDETLWDETLAWDENEAGGGGTLESALARAFTERMTRQKNTTTLKLTIWNKTRIFG